MKNESKNVLVSYIQATGSVTITMDVHVHLESRCDNADGRASKHATVAVSNRVLPKDLTKEVTSETQGKASGHSTNSIKSIMRTERQKERKYLHQLIANDIVGQRHQQHHSRTTLTINFNCLTPTEVKELLESSSESCCSSPHFFLSTFAFCAEVFDPDPPELPLCQVRINVSKNSMRECARAVITREEGCASRRKHETGTPSVTAAPSRPC